MAYFLQGAPFLRCLILNGSLAQGVIKISSDIDLLIIAKTGRIFTTRFLVNCLTRLIGQKRPNDETKPHGGKFCLNYFLTENFLKIPLGRGREMDQYCAENYSKSILVAGDQRLFEKFMSLNSELFLLNQRSSASRRIKDQNDNAKIKRFFPIKTLFLFILMKIIAEVILSTWVGDRVEEALRWYQVRRIELDPRTEKYPNLIVYSDKELRFHPPKTLSSLTRD